MAHQLSPENARRFWNAWKKLKLSEGKQLSFNFKTPRTTPRARSKIIPILTPQGTIVYNVNGPGPNNHNKQRALVGRNERIHYYKTLNELINKYHVPVKFMKHNIGNNWARSLEPIYGFGGLTNRVKRAQLKRKKELEAIESVRPYANKWRINSQTRKAEKMIQNKLIERMKNIERKIALVQRAPNGQARNNARRNARRAINNSMLNSSVKNMYLRNLNRY